MRALQNKTRFHPVLLAKLIPIRVQFRHAFLSYLEVERPRITQNVSGGYIYEVAGKWKESKVLD